MTAFVRTPRELVDVTPPAGHIVAGYSERTANLVYGMGRCARAEIGGFEALGFTFAWGAIYVVPEGAPQAKALPYRFFWSTDGALAQPLLAAGWSTATHDSVVSSDVVAGPATRVAWHAQGDGLSLRLQSLRGSDTATLAIDADDDFLVSPHGCLVDGKVRGTISDLPDHVFADVQVEGPHSGLAAEAMRSAAHPARAYEGDLFLSDSTPCPPEPAEEPT